MKKILVILMAAGLFGVMPALGAEHEGMKMGAEHEGMKMGAEHEGMKMGAEHEGMMMETDEGVRQCALQAESLQQKIKRIQSEIKTGSKKYSAEELKKLEDKLREANKFLDQLTSP